MSVVGAILIFLGIAAVLVFFYAAATVASDADDRDERLFKQREAQRHDKP